MEALNVDDADRLEVEPPRGADVGAELVVDVEAGERDFEETVIDAELDGVPDKLGGTGKLELAELAAGVCEIDTTVLVGETEVLVVETAELDPVGSEIAMGSIDVTDVGVPEIGADTELDDVLVELAT